MSNQTGWQRLADFEDNLVNAWSASLGSCGVSSTTPVGARLRSSRDEIPQVLDDARRSRLLKPQELTTGPAEPSGALSDWNTEEATRKGFPLSVVHFAHRHALWKEMWLSQRLLEKHFRNLWGDTFMLETDMETGESWIAHRFVTAGEVTDIAQAHRSYSTDWVSSVRPGNRFLIRLAYTVI